MRRRTQSGTQNLATRKKKSHKTMQHVLKKSLLVIDNRNDDGSDPIDNTVR